MAIPTPWNLDFSPFANVHDMDFLYKMMKYSSLMKIWQLAPPSTREDIIDTMCGWCWRSLTSLNVLLRKRRSLQGLEAPRIQHELAQYYHAPRQNQRSYLDFE